MQGPRERARGDRRQIVVVIITHVVVYRSPSSDSDVVGVDICMSFLRVTRQLRFLRRTHPIPDEIPDSNQVPLFYL
jgi:hypothetical protein